MFTIPRALWGELVRVGVWAPGAIEEEFRRLDRVVRYMARPPFCRLEAPGFTAARSLVRLKQDG